MTTRWQEHSLGLYPQTAGFGTPISDGTANSQFTWIQGDKPKIQLATDIAELDLMTGVIGAAPERLVGRRHGQISFSMPLEGFKSGYNPITEDPGGVPDGTTGSPAGSEVVPPWLCLLGNALGSTIGTVATLTDFWRGVGLSVSQYTAAGMESGTASSIVTTAPASAKIDGGQLIVAALTAASTAPQFGFVKTKSVNTFTLFEPAANNVNDTAADMFGTANAWLSKAIYNQLPMTMRHVGEGTEACEVLADCICTGIKITWESGAVPTIEFSYNFYDYHWNKTLGTLQIPKVYQRIPQIVGTNNGRATLGRVKAGSFTVAAADAVQCGLESCTWEYKVEIAEIKCHSAAQGISNVVFRKPRISASANIPWSSSDEVRNSAGTAGNIGSHWWQSQLELGQRLSLGVYVGSTVGRLFAFLIPFGRLVAVPQVVDMAGADGFQLAIEASTYTDDMSDIVGDTVDTCPINSLGRISLG